MEASYDPAVDAAYLGIRSCLAPTRTDGAEDGTIIDRDDETGQRSAPMVLAQSSIH